MNKINIFIYYCFCCCFIEERENIFSYLAQAGIAVLILNITMMIFVYFIAQSFVTANCSKKMYFIRGGLQNGTLAVFVATQIFDDILYAIPTAAYGLIMYITGFIFIYILRKTTN